MAVNNYINLQRNDFFSPYLDGFLNLKMSMSPQGATTVYNSNRTITLIPFSTVDRVCHFAVGIGLIIPVINLVISCALRYFATLNLPTLPRPQALPEADAAESRLVAINTDSDGGSLLDTASSSAAVVVDAIPNASRLPEQALSLLISEAQDGPAAAPSSEGNPSSPAALPHVLASPAALALVASRRRERTLSETAQLPEIPEEAGDEEGSDTASLPSTVEPFSHGAGVVPYRFYDGRVELLIGRNREGGKWSYFGGESMREERSIDTAARRCEEVVGGFLGRRADIIGCLNEDDKIGGAYKTYFMPVSDRTITAERFLEPRLALAKTQIAWVTLGELLRVARNERDRLKIDGSQATLHPSFRATLIDPSSQDVLDRITSFRLAQSFRGLHRAASLDSRRLRSVA